MTAGRVFRTSPPETPAKFTCHTSPRRIESVADKRFAPFVGLSLTVPVSGHLRISGRQAFGHDKGPGQIFEEFRDVTFADDGVQAVINTVVDGYGQFSGHEYL